MSRSITTLEGCGSAARSVLICDDRRELRDAIRLTLTRNPQFRVVGEAWDGATCLAHVREVRPDILILDVNMPGGGPDVARAVRQALPAVQILVFSGCIDRRVRRSMLDAGADDYVGKTGRLQPLLDGLSRADDRLTVTSRGSA